VRYLPDWFPGTEFKRTARQWGRTLTDLTERPYAFVKHQMSQGKHETSFLSQLLEQGDLDPEETFIVKWSAMSLYSAGADTVRSILRMLTDSMHTDSARLSHLLHASFWR
jgi:hypothetical protein